MLYAFVRVLRGFTQLNTFYTYVCVLRSFTRFQVTQMYAFNAVVRVLLSCTRCMHLYALYGVYSAVRALRSSTLFTHLIQLFSLYIALRSRLFELFVRRLYAALHIKLPVRKAA